MDPDAPQGDASVMPIQAPVEDAPAIGPLPEPVSSPESDAPSPIPPPDLEVAENPVTPVSIESILTADPATPTSGASAPVPQSADPAVAAAPAFDPYSADEISFLKNVLGPKAIERTGVRLLLRVSSSSATRYLTALVASGCLARHHTQDDNLYKVVG